MSKISIIGAGNVGATCANAIAHMNYASEIILLDIKQGFAEGKATDMMQSAKQYGFDCNIKGITNDYKATEKSDIVVVTSGIPRKPGMTREELIGVNAGIVKEVIENVLKHSPKAVIIIVSNPMDTMTYLANKITNLPQGRIFGMGGALDSSRFRYYLSNELGCAQSDIQCTVIGGHSDTTMVPLISKATLAGEPVTNLLKKDKLEEIKHNTMIGGATLTRMLNTSAWYAPGSSIAMMCKSIILDQKKIFPCSVYLNGEYNQKDICIGVPAMIGKKGIEKIMNFTLTEEEKEAFNKSAEAVKKTNSVLHDMNLI
ncbi:MAG: malate dehydrogenase [Bacteroidales bacterium]|jgi:malate dehydrogenase|nr:malate dehydrogenase [Bacteroidales bacterium]MCI2122431.1 malate dehydrogenase [Bacteroidales bacterium]MCI2145000.1 malate dehydrogenase [Bacteroidales bacterium]